MARNDRPPTVPAQGAANLRLCLLLCNKYLGFHSSMSAILRDSQPRLRATLFACELKNRSRSARNPGWKGKTEGWCLVIALRFASFRQYQTNKRRKRNADRRAFHSAPAGAAPPLRRGLAYRRSTTALTTESFSSPWLSLRPGFLGRGLRGRYPASPIPVQCCTTHSGHSAGGHDARAARERGVWPRRGHRTRSTPRRYPRWRCPW